MDRIIVQNMFSYTEDYVLLDVRTPLEYESGHIPGAINFPIFSNEERISVGTTYKNVNPQEALILGLEYVGPKMARFVKEAINLARTKKIIIYCWRGGKRSGSMGWLFQMAGLDCEVIEGGYKAYRSYARNQITNSSLDLIILSGQTGSAKTEILHELQKMDHQIIDLEGLANHKGSAFGALGQITQPTTEQFQNNLYNNLQQLDWARPIWVEGESKSIGRVYISEEFWLKMTQAFEIEIDVLIENRIRHLVNSYGKFEKQLLINSFDKISKRLGGKEHKIATEAIEIGDLSLATSIALQYYDKAYKRGRTLRENKIVLKITEKEPRLIAHKILDAINQKK